MDSPKIVRGDDPIPNKDYDWFSFDEQALESAILLNDISKTSSVCFGLIGEWGSGKTSYMRLLKNHIEKKSKNVVAWFVSWDPGSLVDVGDSMLFFLYNEMSKYISEKQLEDSEEFKKQFDKLKISLGIRKSPTQLISKFLSSVSEVTLTPPIVKDASKLVNIAIDELESNQKIRESFEYLGSFLERKKITMYLFIDDIDRITSKQIYDILSELKAYLSLKNFVVIIGYDEKYINEALKGNLPEGIDAIDYMDKIITIRNKLPSPNIRILRTYAENYLTMLFEKIDKFALEDLSAISSGSCLYNVRALKRMLLSFKQHIPSSIHDRNSLITILIITIMDESNILSNKEIQTMLSENNLEGIISKLKNINDESLKNISEIIFGYIDRYEEFIDLSLISNIGIPFKSYMPTRKIEETERTIFYWYDQFNLLLKNKIHKKLVFEGCFDEKHILDISHIKNINEPIEGDKFLLELGYKYSPLYINPINKLDKTLIFKTDDLNILLIITSKYEEKRISNPRQTMREILNGSSIITSKNKLIIWMIDDKSIFPKEINKSIRATIELINKGLKNEIKYYYTPYEKMNLMMEYLINI